MRETWVQSLGGEDPVEKEMATHSSILAWKILWTEEPGSLQSMDHKSQTQFNDKTTQTRNKNTEKVISREVESIESPSKLSSSPA